MHPVARSVLLFAVLLLAQFANAERARSEPNAIPVAKAWFTPHLDESHEPLCETIRKAAAEDFMTAGEIDFGPGEWAPGDFAGLSRVDFENPQSTSGEKFAREMRKLPLYVRNTTFPGCGGACETYGLEVSEHDFQAGDTTAGTNGSRGWGVYTNGAGAYYAISYVQDWLSGRAITVLEAYRLAKPSEWQRTCAVRITPTEAEIANSPGIAAARESVQAFQRDVLAILGQEGSCGTMRTTSRWQQDVETRAAQTLYRPWSVSDDAADKYGTYAEDVRNLEVWSLGGLAEQQLWRHYKEQLETTQAVLSSFYQSQFGLNRERANQLANTALTATASAGIRFYEYDDFTQPNEKALRKALLEHRPLKEIRQLEISAEEIDAADRESVLDIAVAYPEALEYLLTRGFNVNKANAFGKTPLMYAVQGDQLESVKILLARGADPDAATTQPTDTCNYTLTTFGVTPLHYAVRFASSSVVRMLLDVGASTFLQARGDNAGTPLDWLRKYTAADAVERNVAIPENEANFLAGLLKVPAGAELAKSKKELLEAGRVAYFTGKPEVAYRKLRTALMLDEDNDVARNDLALAALRTGRLGESAEASQRVTKSSDANRRAAAFFNLGLACEKYGKRYLEYNGTYYCESSLLIPFLESWQAAPTPARAEKIEQLFTSGALKSCAIGAKSDAIARFHFVLDVGREHPVRARLYALHLSSQQISPADVSWPDAGSLRVSGQYAMGVYTLTVLDSDWYPRDPITIRGESCNGYR